MRWVGCLALWLAGVLSMNTPGTAHKVGRYPCTVFGTAVVCRGNNGSSSGGGGGSSI